MRILRGTDGDDLLVGGDEAEILLGGAGSDDLYGGGGDDWLHPGAGPSQVASGGGGFDTIVRDLTIRSSGYFAYRPFGRVPTTDTRLDGQDATFGRFDAEAVEFTDWRVEWNDGGISHQVYRLYLAVLGRTPEPRGFSHWVEAVVDALLGRQGGVDLHQVAETFLASPERAGRGVAGGDGAFVAQLFRDATGRAASAEEEAAWVGRVAVAGRAAVAVAVAEGAESRARAAATATVNTIAVQDREAAEATALHAMAYGSGAPDQQALAAWDRALEDGTLGLSDLAATFAASERFGQAFGGLTDRAFVEALYRTRLGWAPDEEGAAYWSGRAALGGRGEVLVGLAEDPGFAAAYYVPPGTGF